MEQSKPLIHATGHALTHAPCYSFSYVLGIELDEAALATARENLVEAEVDQVDIIRADVAALNVDSPLLESLKRANFDTVISEWRPSLHFALLSIFQKLMQMHLVLSEPAVWHQESSH